MLVVRLVLGAVLLNTSVRPTVAETNSTAIVQPGAPEKQITRGPGNRILTNIGVWSPDGRWIVYDVRSGPAGEAFDGRRIEVVNVETGEVRVVYTSQNDACCAAASFNPR